jgi:predicted SnoaL-like aldol condensation-catalyzing enzyme
MSIKHNAALLAAISIAVLNTASAEMLDPATLRKGEVGPLTPYGETAKEAAAKKIMYEWLYTNAVERNPQQAFATYVSKDYCNHGHLSTRGQKDCSDYQETVTRWVNNYGKPLQPGQKIEWPTLASVNGEMVTMYGEGVDIFRVKDGKITDHWDASPPAAAHIKAHAPGFLQWLLSERKGPPPGYEGPSTTAVTVTQAMLDKIDVGPVTPYGETAKEIANKRVMFEFNHLNMVLAQPKQAYEKYVSKNYCNHGHLSTRMQKECSGYDESLAGALTRYTKAAKVGDKLEIPTMASVNGEMVTLYGAGVDIFRVVDGKITDHWDGSPPAEVNIKAHAADFVDRMVRTVAGEKDLPMGPGPVAPAPAK